MSARTEGVALDCREGCALTRRADLIVIALALACWGLPCCGSDSGTSAESAWGGGGSAGGGGAAWDSAGGGDTSSSDSSAGASADAGGGAVDVAPLPPEQEKEIDFGAPEGSPNFVFIPVPGEDRVVKVSGKTLAVTLVEIGDQPSVLRAIPGQDAVAVISSGTSELAILQATESKDTTRLVPILPNCNAIAISPDGKWAVVYYDHSRIKGGDPTGSFQAVSLVRLDAADATPRTLSVGFRVRQVEFTSDAKRALIVTDDGICDVAFDSAKDGTVVPPVAITPNPLQKPAEREVRTTSNGAWAIVRQSGLSGLYAIHLASKQLITLPLSSVPTDLDVTPDGKVALAVLRESAEIAFIDLPLDATPTLPSQVLSIAPMTAGLSRLSDDGKTAILYSSVPGIESVAAIDMATRKGTLVALRKSVDYVWLAPGATTALLVHKPAKGPLYDADSTEKFVDDSQGYTLFDMNTGYTKLVLTEAAPVGIAASDKPAKAWVLLPDPKGIAHKVQEAGLQSLLVVDHTVGSAPQHGRALQAAGLVAVSQNHPSGRMTFFDAATGAAKTVTGYELNSLVK